MNVTDIEQLIAIMRRAGVMHMTLGQATCKIAITRGTEFAAPVAPVVPSAPLSQSVAEPQPIFAPSPPASEETIVASPVVGVVRTVPGAPKVGARVKLGQVLVGVEAMKVPNEVRSPCDGVVAAVLVEDGTPVEYGQTLYVIKPDKGGDSDEDEATIGLA